MCATTSTGGGGPSGSSRSGDGTNSNTTTVPERFHQQAAAGGRMRTRMFVAITQEDGRRIPRTITSSLTFCPLTHLGGSQISAKLTFQHKQHNSRAKTVFRISIFRDFDRSEFVRGFHTYRKNTPHKLSPVETPNWSTKTCRSDKQVSMRLDMITLPARL